MTIENEARKTMRAINVLASLKSDSYFASNFSNRATFFRTEACRTLRPVVGQFGGIFPDEPRRDECGGKIKKEINQVFAPIRHNPSYRTFDV